MNNILSEKANVKVASSNVVDWSNVVVQRASPASTGSIPCGITALSLIKSVASIPASEKTPIGTQYLFDYASQIQTPVVMQSSIPLATISESTIAATTQTVTIISGDDLPSQPVDPKTYVTACENGESPNNHEAVESIVGPVEWAKPTEGYCLCPGKGDHTTKDGNHDCVVYLDHAPTIHCVHSSCRIAVEAKNKELRRALSILKPGEGFDVKKRRLTPEDKARLQEVDRKKSIKLRAEASRQQILRNGWPYSEICKASPVALQGNEDDHWRLQLGMFKDDDVIWIGDIRDSGQPFHAKNFKTKAEWFRECEKAPNNFICPATFKPGSFQRGNENVVARRFLVVESDELTRDEVGSVFKWLKDGVGLNLRAIVDTAGKSLHGWFDFPAPDVFEELKLILPVYWCDPKLFTPSQPVRLAGALREGKHQKLVYLAKEVAV